MIDPVMLNIGHIQYIIACKIIGIDDAIRVNFDSIIGSNVRDLASGMTLV